MTLPLEFRALGGIFYNVNTMPLITSVELQELIDETFPEVADVWSFLTVEDDDLMVEWARYNNN